MRRHFHPATILATWFWVGLLRPAPGTWGSLAALPFAWLIQSQFGPTALLLACVAVSALGVWAAGHHATRRELHDPGEIVVDEVAGMWISCLLLPAQAWALWALAFALFRALDVLKPWPISILDRHGSGGLGIMQDDVLAGLFVFAALQLLMLAMEMP
jgi:phosphatidylglycerophosphatase A